jgi:hypothetical protein
MSSFDSKKLPSAEDVIAPDGSEVRVLLALTGGSMAHFQLPAGRIARAVQHRTVEEIWYSCLAEVRCGGLTAPTKTQSLYPLVYA